MKRKPRPVIDPCPVCGQNPCRPTGGTVASLPYMDKQAWKELYQFMRYVQLPFVHQIIARAQERAKEEQCQN